MPVDPSSVPQRRLYTGAAMPAIGLGTFGSDRFSGEEIAEAVGGALEVGYRHFDCASVYENEHLIGPVLEGFPRDQLWITSKLWNDKHAASDVVPACERSLADLRTDYLDMYLVHWPFPNFHPPGCDVSSRSPNAAPLCPQRVHGNLARDGTAGRPGAGPPHRHLQHDDAEARAVAERRPDRPGRERDGAAPALSAARSVRLRPRPGNPADRLLPDRLPDPTGPRPDSGGHRRHRRSGHRRRRAKPRYPPGRGLREVGRPTAGRPRYRSRSGAASTSPTSSRLRKTRSLKTRCWRSPESTGTTDSSRARSSSGDRISPGRTSGTPRASSASKHAPSIKTPEACPAQGGVLQATHDARQARRHSRRFSSSIWNLMPLATATDLLAVCRREGRAVGAFNVVLLEHAEAFVAAAEPLSSRRFCRSARTVSSTTAGSRPSRRPLFAWQSPRRSRSASSSITPSPDASSTKPSASVCPRSCSTARCSTPRPTSPRRRSS